MDVKELEKLSELKEKGMLTDEEFQQAKNKLINGEITTPAPQDKGLKCPKCGSFNVNVQMVENGSVGTSRTKITKKHKGLLYWLIFGWWLQPMIWIFTVPFKMLFGSKKTVGKATTITANKTLNKSMAVCQNCGHSWKVK